MIIPLKVLRHTCRRSNITCDCHQFHSKQQHNFVQAWNTGLQNISHKTKWSSQIISLLVNKRDQLLQLVGFLSLALFLSLNFYLLFDRLTHFYSLSDIQKRPLVLQ